MLHTTGEKPLAGQVAVVTGAGQSIGRAHAIRLSEEGAKVVVNDNGSALSGDGADVSVAEKVAAEIRAAGGEAVANADSVAATGGGRAIVECALDNFGRIDILVNNAGNVRPNLVFDATDEEFESVIGVHLKGTFATTRHAANYFRNQRSGVIVNTGSMAGMGQYGNSIYAAAKEAIVGFTRSIARELGPYGVRCNAIRPGAVSRQRSDEKMARLTLEAEKKFGFPAVADMWLGPASGKAVDAEMEAALDGRHVANLVVWLCTPAAAVLNGATIRVSGGQITLMADPTAIKSIFKADGWDLASLNKPQVAGYLLAGVENRFKPR